MIYAVVQFLTITGVVLVSLWQVAKKFMPAGLHWVQQRASAWLNRKSMPEPIQALGKSLQPAPVPAPSLGCGSGCASCKACVSFSVKKI